MLKDLVFSSARPEDVRDLTVLLGLLFAQETDFTPDPAKQKRALKDILAQPSAGRIFVARSNGRVVAMVNLLFHTSTAEGGSVILLEDLIVHPSCRKRGIGSRLLNHVLDFARRKHFRRITLLTDRRNRSAIRFYKRFGFTSSAMLPMRRKIGSWR